jgi:stage III sporulation protein AB
MIRLVCGLIAAAACALLGIEASFRLKRRVEYLAAWIRALEMLDLRLLHDGIPLREVVLQEGDGEIAKRLAAFSRALADNPRMTSAQAWQASCKSQDTKEEKVLAACFSSLGTGVLEKRRTAIAQAMEQLKVLKEEAEEKAQRDCKLYRSLGLAAGAALLLILL